MDLTWLYYRAEWQVLCRKLYRIYIYIYNKIYIFITKYFLISWSVKYSMNICKNDTVIIILEQSYIALTPKSWLRNSEMKKKNYTVYKKH